jgi:hypothetical protein
MSTAKFDTLSNLAGTQSVPVATVAQGSAKAWVNFNGTGTVAIRAAFNVSSITDNGTGNYTLNFTNALVDVNYTPLGNNLQDTGANNGQVFYAVALNTNSCTMKSGYVSSLGGTVTAVDAPYCWAAIFR